MPELPDVEVFKEYFQATALHKKIKKAEIVTKSLLEDVSAQKLKEHLVDHEFDSVNRHGKYLFVDVGNEGALVLHFGMTGFLKYFESTDKSPDHVHLLVTFADGYHLAYSCQRKLGQISWTEDRSKFLQDKELGPDPLEDSFDEELFLRILKKRRGSVKSLLMNQQAMAGIGNIYSDEILFQCGIHPKRQLADLDAQQQKKLYHCLKDVLTTAIEHRAGERGWPKDWLLPHREPGQDCPRCEGTIRQIKISGRSAYYCTHHQEK